MFATYKWHYITFKPFLSVQTSSLNPGLPENIRQTDTTTNSNSSSICLMDIFWQTETGV